MLSVGAISKINAGDFQEPVVLQVGQQSRRRPPDKPAQRHPSSASRPLLPFPPQITSLDKGANNKFKATFSDGKQSSSGMLATQLSELVEQGSLKVGTIARLNA